MATGGDSNRPNKRPCIEEDKDGSKSFTPRDYQIEILEIAKERNTIACLGTGTGKTFIAVMLIRENANEVRIPFNKGGKRIFFLVPTVPLVNQQKRTIQDHTDLSVKGYFGEMDVDSWSKDQWIDEFEKYEVLVMTAEIFRIIINHAFIAVKQIKLVIFDECHRAQKDHPYRQALEHFKSCKRSELPRIFGLSASLLNGKCKPTSLEKRLKELESTMMSSITTASDIVDLQRYGTDPNEFVVYYSTYAAHSAADLINETLSLMNKLKSQEENSKAGKSNKGYRDSNMEDIDIVFFNKPLKCLNSLCVTLESLGPWCAYQAAEIYSREIKTLLLRPIAQNNKQLLQDILDFLKYFKAMCLALNGGSDEVNTSSIPDKLKRLLEILTAAKKSAKFTMKESPLVVDVTFEENPLRHHEIIEQNKMIKRDQQICSIIFVQQRITAFVLCQWLLKMKEKCPELNFMKPDFIVGHGSIGVAETSMSEKLQRKKVKAFRDQECNILVATCVIEEGMDIRQCNVVVRFDLPLDFRSYVQSKGRARAKNSIYVLLVEEGEDDRKFLEDICNFKTIEELLLSKCQSRDLPTEEEISLSMADSIIPPYMPRGIDGPRITMSSAISLINRYCSNLPCDMATKLVPRWIIKKSDPDNIAAEYICTLRMPINSPLKKIIEGEPMKRKRLAKMSAALKACEELDEIGELNEHLVPISCLVDKALEELGKLEEEEDDGSGAQAGTSRRRRVYEKRVPIFLLNTKPVSGKPCYLHVIKMDLVFPLPDVLNPRKRPIIDPADTTRGLGLLCSCKLPPVNSFPLFTKCGKILVEIQRMANPIIVTEFQITMIEEFHRSLFSDVLGLEECKTFSPSDAHNSYYILPTNMGNENVFTIDWEFMEITRSNIYYELRKNNKSPIPKTTYNENLFTDAVLLRSYKMKFWDSERPTFHHVTKIRNDMSPESVVVDSKKHQSYKEYYQEEHNIIVKNDNQPLIETVQYLSLHLWKPIYLSPKETFDDQTVLSKTKQRRRDYREYLIPELCIVHPFPSSFFLKVIYIPTVLFRLNGLLLAEEIRQTVSKEVSVGTMHVPVWPPFHLESSDKDLRKHLFENHVLKEVDPGVPLIPKDIRKKGKYIDSFEVNYDMSKISGPSPSLLLQAMTTKSTGDEFDLERLEMIGDSFLKYAMTVEIYIKYYVYDEGKLTLLRSKLIQNLCLYKQAKKKDLGEYLTNTCFNCNSTWLPPCYCIHEKVDEKSLIKKAKNKKDEDPINKSKEIQELHRYFTKQVISDKSVADSVEALIGAYLLSCGQQGALRFMFWLGLNPLVNESDDITKWPPPPPNPIVFETDNIQQRLLQFTDGFNRFEDKINYRFKNKAYLLQAFTHPSYCYNDLTDCYQRLEFLGDAVLDYLITRQLYEDPNDHSPGKLTDLRSALVNNIFFASLAVHFKYNEFLKMCSPTLFQLMNHYITILKESEAFKFFEEHKYYLEEIECFELEEVEVPKALGDVFESVAGAIYLDSGMSLDAVWKVYFPMIKPSLDHLSQYVPVSPVRELYEMTNSKDLFGEPIEKNGKTYIQVVLPNGQTFEGVGPNKRVAKKSAAKRAVVDLKKTEKMDIC